MSGKAGELPGNRTVGRKCAWDEGCNYIRSAQRNKFSIWADRVAKSSTILLRGYYTIEEADHRYQAVKSHGKVGINKQVDDKFEETYTAVEVVRRICLRFRDETGN